MKCDDIDKLVLASLIFTVLGDFLALVAELATKRCETTQALESKATEQALLSRLDEYERRITKLELHK